MRWLLAAAMLLLAGPAFAQNAAERIAGAVFSEVEREVIREGLSRLGIDPDSRVGDAVRDTVRGRDGDDDAAAEDDKDDDDDGKDRDRKDSKGKESKGKKGKGKKGKGGGMPPGLAKRDSLPPGLAKRDTLPPGLAKRDLPAEVEAELPPTPRGTQRAIVGDDVVLIDTATNTVLDIIRGVATGRK